MISAVLPALKRLTAFATCVLLLVANENATVYVFPSLLCFIFPICIIYDPSLHFHFQYFCGFPIYNAVLLYSQQYQYTFPYRFEEDFWENPAPGMLGVPFKRKIIHGLVPDVGINYAPANNNDTIRRREFSKSIPLTTPLTKFFFEYIQICLFLSIGWCTVIPNGQDSILEGLATF